MNTYTEDDLNEARRQAWEECREAAPNAPNPYDTKCPETLKVAIDTGTGTIDVRCVYDRGHTGHHKLTIVWGEPSCYFPNCTKPRDHAGQCDPSNDRKVQQL